MKAWAEMRACVAYGKGESTTSTARARAPSSLFLATPVLVLVIAVIAILIPAGFHAAFDASIENGKEKADILKMSRGTSVIVLVIYVAYLFFQLWTHAHLYDERPGQDTAPTRQGRRAFKSHRILRAARSVRNKDGPPPKKGDAPAATENANEEGYEDDDEHEEPEEPTLKCVLCDRKREFPPC